MQIITHRGLRPSQKDFFSESSFEAFNAYLAEGWALEFDPAFLLDGIAVTHDHTVQRLTHGQDQRPVTELTMQELLSIELENGHLCSLDQLLDCMRHHGIARNALHLKGAYQTTACIERLIEALQKHGNIWDLLFIFDVTPQTARKLKAALPRIQIGASVAHPFDIERYQAVVHGTLLTLDEVISYKDLYQWVWLDEWDLCDRDGGRKELYTAEIFAKARQAGFQISLVTPELHGTSPGLLGGERHPDAHNSKTLLSRIERIVSLQPDGICTDYPDEVAGTASNVSFSF